MIQMYQKVTRLRVLAQFFEFPGEGFYLRELARILGMSPMTVKRALSLLVSDGLILRIEEKNRTLFRANTESHTFRYAKISYNLAVLEDKRIVEDLLEDVPGISSIMLYGSYARGENDTHSDLDILVISTAKKVDASEISKKIGVMVNVMNFTSTQWTKQAKDNRAFYLDVITEGIVLHGTRPVIE